MSEARTNQHYVPQFLLRGFASGRQRQIYVLDKRTHQAFRTRTRNIAAQNGFYDVEINGRPHSVDPLLGELEGRTAPIVQAIRKARHLRFLTEDQRYVLGLFVVSQMLRTDAQRQQYKHLNDLLVRAIVQAGGDPNKVEGFQPQSDEESRRDLLLMLPKLALDLLPNILNKTWVLYRTPLTEQFYSSDNPVVMHNTVNQSPHRGTLGLGVQGIEICLPLSRSLSLGFLCSSLEEMLRDGEARARRIGAPISFDEWMKAFNDMTPLLLESENVVHLNSLQVINAERYIFSQRAGFGLALEMLDAHPELRSGPRLTMAG